MNYKKKIKYILPDFMSLNRNKILMDIFEKYQVLTRKNTMIYSFYGTFPGCIWNGGRPDISNFKYSKKYIRKLRDFYNERGIKVTFTFTNSLLRKEQLEDEYCNTILEIFNNGMNEVLVASAILEEYIRQKYPGYKVNKSITIADGKLDYDISKYNLVVIDKKLNRDFKYLKKIEQKQKIEILCDETCFNDCPYTKKHYEEISALQLGEQATHELFGKCRFLNRVHESEFIAYRNKNSNYYISPDKIEVYNNLGFEYFKLSGREKFNFHGLESIIDYLIKPEFQLDVRTYILESIMQEIREDVQLGILKK